MGSARDASAEPAAGSRCPARAPQRAQSPQPRHHQQGSAPSSCPAADPPKLSAHRECPRWDGSPYRAHARAGGESKKIHTWIVLTCSHLPAAGSANGVSANEGD